MMHPRRSRLMVGVAICAAVGWAWLAHGQAQVQGEGTLLANPHEALVTTFEGTKTCLGCHQTQAEHAFDSIHYQWKAPAPNIVNAGKKKIGKINSTNDFCTNPAFQWIGILTNDQGRVLQRLLEVPCGPRREAVGDHDPGAAREHRLPDLPRAELPARGGAQG